MSGADTPPRMPLAVMSFREDNNTNLVRLDWTFPRLFTGRYAVRTGKRLSNRRWRKPQIQAVRASQQETPVWMMADGQRQLWYFHDKFYWDSDKLTADDVKALVLRRERSLKQELDTAHSLMRAEEAGRPTRSPIPTDLRRAVFERDGGKCVECESGFDIQYDHVLPVALGGATTVENLQLLCADCNRRKGAHL
jgi:5-methylcytosine-specific restriction endonuclease McrA